MSDSIDMILEKRHKSFIITEGRAEVSWGLGLGSQRLAAQAMRRLLGVMENHLTVFPKDGWGQMSPCLEFLPARISAMQSHHLVVVTLGSVTGLHRPHGLNRGHPFLTALEAGGPRSRHQQGQPMVTTRLGLRQLPTPCVLTGQR